MKRTHKAIYWCCFAKQKIRTTAGIKSIAKRNPTSKNNTTSKNEKKGIIKGIDPAVVLDCELNVAINEKNLTGAQVFSERKESAVLVATLATAQVELSLSWGWG